MNKSRKSIKEATGVKAVFLVFDFFITEYYIENLLWSGLC